MANKKDKATKGLCKSALLTYAYESQLVCGVF